MQQSKAKLMFFLFPPAMSSLPESPPAQLSSPQNAAVLGVIFDRTSLVAPLPNRAHLALLCWRMRPQKHRCWWMRPQKHRHASRQRSRRRPRQVHCGPLQRHDHPPSQVCPYEKLCRPKPCGAQVFATTGLYSCGLWPISSGLFLRVIAPMALASALAFSCAQSQPQQMGVSTALHFSVHSEHKNIASYTTMEHKQHTMDNQINRESQDTNTEGRRKRKKEKQRGR